MRNYETKLVDSSRLIADLLIEDIGEQADRFEEMLQLALRDEYPVSMRAARIIALSVEKFPWLMNAHVDRVIEKLPVLKVEGVRRGMLKMFTVNQPDINEEQIGILTDLAFRWLTDPKEAIAIRYYSIEIILFVCKIYPELKNELVIILNGLVNESSPGISSKCREVLISFEKRGAV